MHLGLILPNFGEAASPKGIRRAAVAAEELGFDSVAATVAGQFGVGNGLSRDG